MSAAQIEEENLKQQTANSNGSQADFGFTLLDGVQMLQRKPQNCYEKLIILPHLCYVKLTSRVHTEYWKWEMKTLEKECYEFYASTSIY
ncbi:unnamed protein product, partial [Ceratitis capitata]